MATYRTADYFDPVARLAEIRRRKRTGFRKGKQTATEQARRLIAQGLAQNEPRRPPAAAGTLTSQNIPMAAERVRATNSAVAEAMAIIYQARTGGR